MRERASEPKDRNSWLIPVALIIAFIGAGYWWRADNRPLVSGLIIVGAAVFVVLIAVVWFRQRSN